MSFQIMVGGGCQLAHNGRCCVLLSSNERLLTAACCELLMRKLLRSSATTDEVNHEDFVHFGAHRTEVSHNLANHEDCVPYL